MWTVIKTLFIIKLSGFAIFMIVTGGVAFLDRTGQRTPEPPGGRGDSVVDSPLLAVVAPNAATVHSRLKTWEADGAVNIGDGITTSEVYLDIAADSGWYTATDDVASLTIVKSGDQLFLQGVGGTQVWYQLRADESAGDLLWPFEVTRVETLADYVPEPTRPFAYLKDNGTTMENDVLLDKFKLRFDVAAMRADDAALQALDAEWDFPPTAVYIESDVGFDSDGIARWSLNVFHQPNSEMTTWYRNDLISFGNDPVILPEVTNPQPLPPDINLDIF